MARENSPTAGTVRTFVFAGGGTGGHLFPGLAIAEQIRAIEPAARCVFMCSDKSLDADILKRAGAEFVAIPAKAFGVRPRALLKFVRAWGPSVRASRRVLRETGATHVLAMGGYVAAPVVQAARAERVAVTLVNLDAVPGKANRWIARHAGKKVTAARISPHAGSLAWEEIPPIIRAGAVAPGSAAEARVRLGIGPELPTLLVTGGSQGAGSINRVMTAFAEKHAAGAMRGWQVLHQTGAEGEQTTLQAYERAGVRARVVAFLPGMGDAWAAADVAVCRSGAGTVAEVWANGVPTVFLPYPYHKDEHQRWNAAVLESAGGAVVVRDEIEPGRTLPAFEPVLLRLLSEANARENMRSRLRALGPADGAKRVAALVVGG